VHELPKNLKHDKRLGKKVRVISEDADKGKIGFIKCIDRFSDGYDSIDVQFENSVIRRIGLSVTQIEFI
jgi:hypothetical protein